MKVSLNYTIAKYINMYYVTLIRVEHTFRKGYGPEDIAFIIFRQI